MKRPKRHFVQQSHKYNPKKHSVTGKFMSEKLDGQRAIWDGGISRGILKSEIPWANTTSDERYLNPPIATGLWTRYGNVIHAPNWFLDKLPNFPLDGELWAGRGRHQKVRKIVSTLIPDEIKWKQVIFMVFDTFHFHDVFFPSLIDIPNFYKQLPEDIQVWIRKMQLQKEISTLVDPYTPFEEVYECLTFALPKRPNVVMYLPQTRLPDDPKDAEIDYENYLSYIMQLGGEGVVTRDPEAYYYPARVHHCIKNKPYKDDEGIVIGYVTGRQTTKGSKLLGLMGAAIVSWEGKTFKVSGFTDEERTLGLWDDVDACFYASPKAEEWAKRNPDTLCPDDIGAINFPPGTKITFKYRELTDDGIPKEASYYRLREIE